MMSFTYIRFLPLRVILAIRRKDIFGEYRRLQAEERLSAQANQEIQSARLKALLTHACRYVPYYREVLQDTRVVEGDRVHLERLVAVPTLTKKILREQFERLKSTDPRMKSRKPFVNTSGGSTGEPTRLMQDQTVWTTAMAAKWLYYSFAADFPTRFICLWGSERDILEGGIGLMGGLKNWLYGRSYLNAFSMSPADMDRHITVINRNRPRFIEAYVQPLYELSRHILERGIAVVPPAGVFASAGTLYSDMRESIEQAFRCPVLNRYGSREVGDIACSCPRSAELHTIPGLHYVEIVNRDDKPTPVGDVGRILVTMLYNYSMPLIRFDIGDMGALSGNTCQCGRPFPMLKEVVGREMSMLRTRDGRLLSGELFIHFVGVVYNNGSIERFQVIQEDYERITVKVVLRDAAAFVGPRDSIASLFRRVIGEGCDVRFEQVDHIAPLPSGKYVYTISKVTVA